MTILHFINSCQTQQLQSGPLDPYFLTYGAGSYGVANELRGALNQTTGYGEEPR